MIEHGPGTESPREPPEKLRAALLPGGAVVFDGSGQISFGISDEALTGLVGDAPDFVREAVAHLAARRAAETRLVETVQGVGEEEGLDTSRAEEGPPETVSGIELAARVVRSNGFLGGVLLVAGMRAWERGPAVLPLVESGSRFYLGPLLVPEGSPCIMCVRRAVAPNRKSEGVLGPGTASQEGPRLADARALSLFSRHAGHPTAEILELDLDGRVVGRHRVRSNPACAVCGDEVAAPNDACPDLLSRPKRARTDTGARAHEPCDTLGRYRHLVSPLTGAVRRLRRVETTDPDLIHVYTASHAMSEEARSFAAIMRDGRDQSGGKGSTGEQARVSALCEALERFSAVAVGGEIDATGKVDDVDGAVHPEECLQFSDAQYDGRDAWNRSQSRFQYVPRRLPADVEIAWSRVWDVGTREPAYLPTSLLYFGFDGQGSDYCRADSNGLAAGETLEEAVLQGYLELVERDAVAIWWYNRLRMPGVDVASFEDPYVERVFEHYAALGRRAWVLDLTSDMGIPVFAAMSARSEDAGPPEVIFGFGAHLDPCIALRRCVTEMNQMLATVTRSPDVRRTQLLGEFDDALAWWGEATLADNLYVVPSTELARRRRECFDYVVTDDLKDDLDACLAVAERQGSRVYVRDMSRADLGIAVAKVVVPGLRHFWRRLGKGRLYDAPVTMGHRAAPLSEQDMNPISFFV